MLATSMTYLWGLLWPIAPDVPLVEASKSPETPKPDQEPKPEPGQQETPEPDSDEDQDPKEPDEGKGPEDVAEDDQEGEEEKEEEAEDGDDSGDSSSGDDGEPRPEEGGDEGEDEGETGDTGEADGEEGKEGEEPAEEKGDSPGDVEGESDDGEGEGTDPGEGDSEGTEGPEGAQAQDEAAQEEGESKRKGDEPGEQDGSERASEAQGRSGVGEDPKGAETEAEQGSTEEADGTAEDKEGEAAPAEDGDEEEGDEDGDEEGESGKGPDGESGEEEQNEQDDDDDDDDDGEDQEDDPVSPPASDESVEELRRRALLSGLFPDLRHVGTTQEPPGLDPYVLERLAQMFSQDPYRRFIDMLGRMSADAWMPARREPSNAVDDVRDIVIGRDISKVLMSELVRFQIPALRTQAYVDLAEGRLMQRQMEGVDPRGRGPIIVAVDVSASMNTGLPHWGLSRMNVARLMVLGLLRIAQIQKRVVHLCAFNQTLGGSLRVYTLEESLQTTLAVMNLKAGGGTSYQPPLQWAFRLARVEKQADILIITDGEAPVTTPEVDASQDLRHSLGTRIFTLQLAVEGKASSLSGVSDQVVYLSGEEDLVGLTKKISQAAKK